MRIRHLITSVVLTIMLPLPAAAQNREHLQMNADLRMLQEQVSKLQLANNQLAEQLKTTGRRLDEIADANVKGFANQQLLINQISGTVTTMLEKLQDNSVRVAQITQEFSAIREGVRMLTDQINTLVSLLRPPVNPNGTDAAGTGSAAAGSLPPVVLPPSPRRYYDQAFGDYMSERYDNAIEGFREMIQKFPTAPDAAEAQYYVGESYFRMKQYRPAIAEYQKVVTNYKDSDFVREAYLMQGICYSYVNDRTNAIRLLRLVRDTYPGTAEATQAVQKLKGMDIAR